MKKLEKFKSANLKADLRNLRGGDGYETERTKCTCEILPYDNAGGAITHPDEAKYGDWVSTC